MQSVTFSEGLLGMNAKLLTLQTDAVRVPAPAATCAGRRAGFPLLCLSLGAHSRALTCAFPTPGSPQDEEEDQGAAAGRRGGRTRGSGGGRQQEHRARVPAPADAHPGVPA